MKNVIVPIENMSLVRRVLLGLKEKLIRTNRHTANIDLWCELEVRDKDGKLVSYKKFKSKSFVSNFAAMLRNYMIFQPQSNNFPIYSLPTGVSGTAYTNTLGNPANQLYLTGAQSNNYNDLVTGTGRGNFNIGNMLPPISPNAPSGDDSYGILVGSGTTAPQTSDYALSSKLTNSQIAYGQVSIDASLSSPSSTQTVFRITRTFTNNGTATINVSESGLVVKTLGWDVVGTTAEFENILIAHDVFTAQSVASGQVLTVRYIITFNV